MHSGPYGLERDLRRPRAACDRARAGAEVHRPKHLDRAEDHYQAALSLAAELGMRPLVAHCHLGLGTLYRRTGDAAKAQEHRTTASRMYREMSMAFWLEKTEAMLGPFR